MPRQCKSLRRTVRVARHGAAPLVLLFVHTAASQERFPDAELTVEGQRYGVYSVPDGVVAAPLPLHAELRRNPTVAAPACAQLDSALSNYQDSIEFCKTHPESSCSTLNDLLATLRVDRGEIGRNSLRQGWAIAPVALSVGNNVRSRVAELMRLEPDAVQLASAVEPVGSPESGQVLINPAGSSWASRLLGLPGASDATLTFDEATRQWLTEDQILACGMLAGDVRVTWVHSTRVIADGPAAAPSFFDAEQWAQLRSAMVAAAAPGASSVQERVLRIGLALAETLVTFKVDDAELEAAARNALEGLFADRELLKLRDLEEILATSEARSDSATLRLSWVGSVANEVKP